MTISYNMNNLEESAGRLLLHREPNREQEEETLALFQGSSQEKAQYKDNRKVIQAYKDTIKKLQDRIKNLLQIADWTTKWLENKTLSAVEIIDKKRKIEGEYHIISNQIQNVQARNGIQTVLFNISYSMKQLNDTASRLLLQIEPTPEQVEETLGFSGEAHTKTINEASDRIKNLQEIVDWTRKCLENEKLSTNDIIHKKREIEGEYDHISSQIKGVNHSINAS